MDTKRLKCADSPYGKTNCPYAKVKKEYGIFPFVSFRTEKYPDGRLEKNFYLGIESCRFAVYCMLKRNFKKYVGTVEPYGGECYVEAEDCPKMNGV